MPCRKPRSRTALLCTALLLSTPFLAATDAHAASGPHRGRSECVTSPSSSDSRARAVRDAVTRVRTQLKLRAVQVRVTQNGRDVWTGALGPSMTGVPARPDMRFRAGSIGIAFMNVVLLQLADEHRISLDDPISRWLPEVPHADQITLRMLGDSTSGIKDYVKESSFVTELLAHPFKHWTPQELLAIADPAVQLYPPGKNFSYSHANYVLLGAALERITHTRLDQLLEQRISRPYGLRATSNGYTPDIPAPVLHAFTSARGPYEESTFWNPSWTTAPGAVITMDICDLAGSAAAIGSGKTLSRQGHQTLLNGGTVGLGTPQPYTQGGDCPVTICIPQTQAAHYGMGVIVVNGWIFQNPSFTGYAALMAYLPSEHLAIAVSTTESPETSPDILNPGKDVAQAISQALVPSHPLTFGPF
ncbi:D-alanyl-D-alanine carboxypeptidase [Catenulispora sp. MAP12-49]|uniref:serine hydrolase domain-containing protein n=1 Tax=Catenulispora sp. MAP12-49 TaxID=3156302 RepID=UPI0035191586